MRLELVISIAERKRAWSTEPADLQIICLFKHKASGDTYQGAAKETDEHLHGILSALRNRGEFVGELGETFLFTPPSGSIPAKTTTRRGIGIWFLGPGPERLLPGLVSR